MDWKEELAELRCEIDETDAQIVPLFRRRMEIAGRVAAVKRDHNLSVKDESREQQVVDLAVEQAGEGFAAETSLLMRAIMSLSREYQRRVLFSGDGTPLLPPPRAPKTGALTCAYQGVPGAWGEEAVDAMFPGAEAAALGTFEEVFQTVKQGRADYGVVPIENSKTGAIGETYDLLKKYGCYIVGRTWVDIRQCLVGVPGAALSDVWEVLSHPEGFKQCRNFLQQHHWDETSCRNTAVAAKTVAGAGDVRKAAIASRRAAELYGLEVLAADIMDAADNRTSFVVIAPMPEYDEACDLVSVTFSTKHRSGALCEALLAFLAEDLNLTRIESRPAGEGKYRFFAEVQGNILDERVAAALRQASAASEYFEVLGCYNCVER